MNTAVSWPVQRPDFFEYFKRRAATKRRHNRWSGQFHKIALSLSWGVIYHHLGDIRYPGSSESKVLCKKICAKWHWGAEIDVLHQGQKYLNRLETSKMGWSPCRLHLMSAMRHPIEVLLLNYIFPSILNKVPQIKIQQINWTVIYDKLYNRYLKYIHVVQRDEILNLNGLK